MFGLFDRKKRLLDRAKKKELAGNLDAAIALYVEADAPDEAARLFLLKADAEADPDKRMLLCAQAARVGQDGPHAREAHKRKALIAFDLVRGSGKTTMRGELSRVAAELERCGEWEKAVEAHRLAGDTEAEIRVLKEAGAIEQLEERLRQTSQAARVERDRAQLLRRMRDLDQIAERREAIASARQWLARDHDEQVALELERIRSRLVAGPVIDLEVHGARLTYVLGTTITIGRANADIVVHSGAISRQHLRLSRRDGVAMVEDLATRNGTFLAGARLSGALAIGAGVALDLAGEVPCRLSPAFSDGEGAAPDSPIAVEVAGETHIVPLGPLVIGDWQIVDAHDGADHFIVLRTPDGREPPYMAGYRLAHRIELCEGDELRQTRKGAVVLAVPGPPASRAARSSRASLSR